MEETNSSMHHALTTSIHDKCIVNSSWAPTFHKFGTELTLLYKLLWKTIPFTFLVLLFTWETSWSGENIWGVHDIKVHTTITPQRPHFILFCYFSCSHVHVSRSVIRSVFHEKNIWNFVSFCFFETVKWKQTTQIF
jgi:hypothetical protein